MVFDAAVFDSSVFDAVASLGIEARQGAAISTKPVIGSARLET